MRNRYLKLLVTAFTLFTLQFATQKAHCQTPPKSDTARLLRQLAAHKVNDTAKVILLHKISDDYRILASYYLTDNLRFLHDDFQLKALALSLKLNWEKGFGLNAYKPNFFWVMSPIDKKKLSAQLSEIIPLVEKEKDDNLKCRLFSLIGEIYLGCSGDRTNAVTFYTRAFNYYESHGDVVDELKQLDNLGYAAQTSKSAIEYYNKGLELAKSINNIKQTTHFLNALGEELHTKESDKALIYLQQAYELAEQTGDELEFLGASYYISIIYSNKKNYEKARSVLEKAMVPAAKSTDIFYSNWEFAIQIAYVYTQLKNYSSAEKYYAVALSVSKTPEEFRAAYRQLGDYYKIRANYIKAIEADEKQLFYVKTIGIKWYESYIDIDIGDIYALTGNFSKALQCYNLVLLLNPNFYNVNNKIGQLYLDGQPVKAMVYFKRTLHHADSTKDSRLLKETRGLMAAAFYKELNYSQAFTYARLAVKDSVNNYSDMQRALAFRTMGSVIRDAPDTLLINNGVNPANRYQASLTYLNHSKSIVANTSSADLERDQWKELSLTYEKQRDYTNAFGSYQQYIYLRDSVLNRQSLSKFEQREANIIFNKKADSLKYRQLLAQGQLKQQQQALLLDGEQLSLATKEKALQKINLQAEQNKRRANEQELKASQNKSALANKTVELQKTEINDKRKQSYYLFGGIAALVTLSFFIARNYLNQRKSNELLTDANKIITAEKQRSDDLLLNILPADVAEELKEKGSANARQFDEVTVLFTDFVNFTTVSEHLTPQELVNELDTCFKAFDGIMTTHHIEKIKTIGDAYLAVAGLPNADVNHAANTIKAAFEIQQFIRERKLVLGDKSFDIRIGIHSGSVVAGIVGVKKFAYDIWGDTVNTAARMEQNSEPGRINVSEKTYQLVKDKFTFTYRGEIEAKNKGALKMYFAESGKIGNS